MAAVGAALKKILIIILSNPKARKKLAIALLTILIAIFTPIIAVVAIFCGGINLDTESLNTQIQKQMIAEYGDEFEMMNRTMQQVEDKLEQRHLTQYKLQAEVMYAFNLVDFSESERFVDNYVSCFRANQTDDSFVEAVNRKFSLDIDKEAFKKTIESLRNTQPTTTQGG